MLPARHISLALGRLRLGIALCCWAIGLALLAQMVVWSLATFTDLRYAELHDTSAAPRVVTSDAPRRPSGALRSANDDKDKRRGEVPDPNRVFSTADQIFDHTVTFAAAGGKLACVAMLLLLVVGVILSATSALPGVEKTVSALTWAVVMALLTLPLGEVMDLPWREGAFSSYFYMTEQIELAHDKTEGVGFTIAFYVRFLVYPAACVLMAVMVGMRFGAGTEAARLPDEHKLDPELEKEAGGIQVSSLHGGRSAGALSRVVGGSKPGSKAQKSMPSARRVSPGAAPKRLI
ncbi:MAG: hypothetical protein ACYSTY_12550 [Planctomycetota bacterium]|jgi:hypothetical protein